MGSAIAKNGKLALVALSVWAGISGTGLHALAQPTPKPPVLTKTQVELLRKNLQDGWQSVHLIEMEEDVESADSNESSDSSEIEETGELDDSSENSPEKPNELLDSSQILRLWMREGTREDAEAVLKDLKPENLKGLITPSLLEDAVRYCSVDVVSVAFEKMDAPAKNVSTAETAQLLETVERETAYQSRLLKEFESGDVLDLGEAEGKSWFAFSHPSGKFFVDAESREELQLKVSELKLGVERIQKNCVKIRSLLFKQKRAG